MKVPDRQKSNFLKAHDKLLAFLAHDTSDELVRTAVILAFQFTFETAWRVLRAAADADGVPAPSPRLALQSGITLGFLNPDDESAWLDMLADRNLAAHTYNEDLAIQILARITSRYAPPFEALRSSLYR
jgi:nucleotidyltransferase substrate binding protein (TIGR01987 family)